VTREKYRDIRWIAIDVTKSVAMIEGYRVDTVLVRRAFAKSR